MRRTYGPAEGFTQPLVHAWRVWVNINAIRCRELSPLFTEVRGIGILRTSCKAPACWKSSCRRGRLFKRAQKQGQNTTKTACPAPEPRAGESAKEFFNRLARSPKFAARNSHMA